VWFGEQLATFRSFAVKEFGFILLFDFADFVHFKVADKSYNRVNAY
jgi:hypothetical protein